jgi:hypothetical protein
VDGLVEEVDVEVVVDVLVPETPGRTAGAHVVPVVVVVGDVEMARVDVAEGGVVADEGRLPVVVEVVPRDGDPVGAADDVDLAVLRYVSTSYQT